MVSAGAVLLQGQEEAGVQGQPQEIALPCTYKVGRSLAVALEGRLDVGN
jgi:hypothetical protein